MFLAAEHFDCNRSTATLEKIRSSAAVLKRLSAAGIYSTVGQWTERPAPPATSKCPLGIEGEGWRATKNAIVEPATAQA
jgi:hypothetical protein